MGYIGPQAPETAFLAATANASAEWYGSGTPAAGTRIVNPAPALAAANGVVNSGAMNYIDKFGETSGTYGANERAGELYYAGLRYLEGLPNVADWTTVMGSGGPGGPANALMLDGFPAVSTWSDPQQYSCQQDYILGLGSDNTNYDTNVGGGSSKWGAGGRYVPAAVRSDTLNQADTWTTAALGSNPNGPNGATSANYMAGLAYGAHVTNINTRANLPGTQTVTTWWVDAVTPNGLVTDQNSYWRATKYGGFTVPAGYTYGTSAPASGGLITPASWTNGDTLNMNGTSESRPFNYYTTANSTASSNIGQLVTNMGNVLGGLNPALQTYSTSFAMTNSTVAAGGSPSYTASYNPSDWSGVVTGGLLTVNSAGVPSQSTLWSTAGASAFASELAGAGSASGTAPGRRIITFSPSGGATPGPARGSPIAFEWASLNSAQQNALNVKSWEPQTSTDGSAYLSYLRGSQINETGSTATGSTHAYRARNTLLGDIVNAKLAIVGAPQMAYSEANNPGYTAYKSAQASRPTVVYAGANDGMLHAFDGTPPAGGNNGGYTGGQEIFAYVPSAMYLPPDDSTDSLLGGLGNPTATFGHHYMVDATPAAYDVDLAYTCAGSANNNACQGGLPAVWTPNWATVLVGGLGKGGKSFYALNVTNPSQSGSESALASQTVGWEFGVPGYSYGTSTLVKTKTFGWVALLTSGITSDSGLPDGTSGALYLVNPATGALLSSITASGGALTSSGLTQAAAYTPDFTDETADAVYAGDLNGQMWRFDLTDNDGVCACTAQVIARATDPSGNPQPITAAPLIEIDTTRQERMVMFGTGELLDNDNVNGASATQTQSFYAVPDGTGAFGGFAGNTGAIAARGNLINLTSQYNTTELTSDSGNSTCGAAGCGSAPTASATLPATGGAGWFVDLVINGGNVATAGGWRVTTQANAYDGVVMFSASMTAGVTNPCTPAPALLYAIAFDTGQSALQDNVGNPITYLQDNTGVVDPPRAVQTPTGVQAIYGNPDGPQKINVKWPAANPLKPLNWEEIPLGM